MEAHAKTFQLQISTHALAWRATSLSQTSLSQKSRFLPTPSHGGRLCQVHGSTTPRRFLPTPSHGGRRVGLLAGSLPSVISTHALTWRATFFVSPFHIGCIFLPTPSHGGRLLFDSSAARSHRDFYPRPHMEGDGIIVNRSTSSTNFYPRPHMEGDP